MFIGTGDAQSLRIGADGQVFVEIDKDGRLTALEESSIAGLFCGRTARVAITNAQVRALNTTRITLVPAQGAKKVIIPIGLVIHHDYGGTNAWTDGGVSSLEVDYDGDTTALFSIPAGVITATTDLIIQGLIAAGAAAKDTAVYANTALTLRNPAAAFAGNAALDNTLNAWVPYFVIQIP